MNSDWEECLPWLSLATLSKRAQGLVPTTLCLAIVRGPLVLLQENCREAQPPQNLTEYIDGFRYRLYKAQEVAKNKLVSAQSKMTKLYDRQVENRVFLPGPCSVAHCYHFRQNFLVHVQL